MGVFHGSGDGFRYLDNGVIGSIMEIMFTREQYKTISGILADLGQVCAGSIVEPFLFPSN